MSIKSPMTLTIKFRAGQRIITMTLLLGVTLLLTAGCGSARAPYKPIPAPAAAVVTDVDIDNLLRIIVELRQEVVTLRQEVRALQARR